MGRINKNLATPSSSYAYTKDWDWCSYSVLLTEQTLKLQDKKRLLLLPPNNIGNGRSNSSSKAMAAAAAATAAVSTTTSLLDPEGSIRLLGPKSSNPLVRKYAVTRLRPLSDPDLQLYLLYLVRALRFENFDAIKDGLHAQLVDCFEEEGEEVFEDRDVVEEEEEEEDENDALLPLRRPESCPDLTSPSGKKPFLFSDRNNSVDAEDAPDEIGELERLLRNNSSLDLSDYDHCSSSNSSSKSSSKSQTPKSDRSLSDDAEEPEETQSLLVASSPKRRSSHKRRSRHRQHPPRHHKMPEAMLSLQHPHLHHHHHPGAISSSSKEISASADLGSFLIERCSLNFKLANYFYWYLNAECESMQNGLAEQEMYLIILKRFLMTLEHGSQEQQRYFSVLRSQHRFVSELASTVTKVANAKGVPRPRRLQRLKEMLASPRPDRQAEHGLKSLSEFEPIPMPLDPEVVVDGIATGRTDIFKSATLPCKLFFRKSDFVEESETDGDVVGNGFDFGGEEDAGFYKVIFKVGNDLRRDQFALQTISLFDRILLESGLDLKVTPYKVIATSANCGFVEFVESQSVSAVGSRYGSIRKFFAAVASPQNPFQLIVNNFSKSCAAYSVMTYLLGVGDRHLENLLLTRQGCLLHVDFAFLLGRDPTWQPLPPPMRITRDMIEAMGGSGSEAFRQFRQYCHTAYLVLRRNSDLILSLLSLMSNSTFASPSAASASAFAAAAESASSDSTNHLPSAEQVVRERLRLDLSEREAVRHIDHLVHLSSSAVVASVVERIHKLAQAIRS